MNDPVIHQAWRQINIIFERHSQDGTDSSDTVLWRPLVKLWSDAMLRRRTKEMFKAVDAEAAPIVPVNDLGQTQDTVAENWWDCLLFDATPSPFLTSQG